MQFSLSCSSLCKTIRYLVLSYSACKKSFLLVGTLSLMFPYSVFDSCEALQLALCNWSVAYMLDMSMVENSVQKIAERKKDILAAFAVSHF